MNTTPKILHIHRREILTPFTTPPENGGQIVTVSYAGTEEYILRSTSDASEPGPDKIEAFLPAAGETEFEPWNGAPKLGRRIGTVEISA